jgi:hypothetical protein
MLTKPNILRLVTYILFFAAALYWPVNKVLKFERPAVPPVEMRFKVSAYDPYDPMRGRYLRLHVDCPAKEGVEPPAPHSSWDTVTAVLEKDEAGFAVVSALMKRGDTPPAGKPFVKGATPSFGWAAEEKRINGVLMPFDRFFLNEPLAEKAKKLLNEVTRDPQRSAVLVVDVHRDGNWAVKALLIDGKPICEVLRAAK